MGHVRIRGHTGTLVGGAIFSKFRNTDVMSWHPLIFSGAQGVACQGVRRRTGGSLSWDRTSYNLRE